MALDRSTDKNILFVAYWFPPGGGHGVQRSTKFVKYLPEFGYKPLVLTGAEEDIQYTRDATLLEEVRDTAVYRCRSLERFIGHSSHKFPLHFLLRLLLRPDNNILAWAPAAKRMARRIAEEHSISAVFATLMPTSSIVLGMRLKKLLGVPLIVDYRDFWTTCTWRVWPTKLHHWFEMYQERRVLEAADAVIVVTPTMKDILARRFPQFADKIHVICNGFDPDDIPQISKPKRADNDGKLQIGFAGVLEEHDACQRWASLGPINKLFCVTNAISDFTTQSPLYLLRAVRALLDERPELESKLALSFAGEFGEKNLELVKELRLQKVVSARGYLPHAQSVQHLIDSDVLFLPLSSHTDGRRSYTYSGKVFEYMGTKRPILAAVPQGDARDLITEARAGWCVDPHDVGAIKSLVEDLIEKKASGTLNLDANEQYIKRFDRRELTRQLAGLFDSVLDDNHETQKPTPSQPVSLPPKDTIRSLTTPEIQAAYEWVVREFPFPGYLSEGVRHYIQHVVPTVSSHVTSEGAPKLLDIGCGPMDKTAVFQKLGFECFSVDDLCDPWHQRDNNRDKIRSFAEKLGISFHLQSATDYSIPFPEEHFDVVTILDVIEHLHDGPRGILATAGRHLKPGGVLCITMPNSVNARKRFGVMCGKSNYPPVDDVFWCPEPWRGHVREYTLSETKFICQAAGFEVLSATTCEGFAHKSLSGLSLKLFLAVSYFFPTLRSLLCVVARKPAGWTPPNADPDRLCRPQKSHDCHA